LEGILAQAYSADPASVSIAALYEGLLVEADRTDAILETQEALLKELRDPSQKADASFCFGVRWALRHQNAEVGARFLETALRLDPAREPAFTYLRENLGNQAGDWDYVVGLADELADRSGAGSSAVYLLASGGLIAWREQGDLIKAKRFFVRLAQLDPSHPALQAFEQQIGEKLGRQDGSSVPERIAQTGSMQEAALTQGAGASSVAAMSSSVDAAPAVSRSDAPPASTEDPAPARTNSVPPSAASISEAPAATQTQDDGKVAELREKLAQVEKRPH